MYAVEIDSSKRLLVISGAGHVTAAEVQQALRRVQELLPEMTPDFRVLTDFRWLESMDSASAHHVGEIMDALAAKNVRLVVRVMPDPHKDIGLNILSQFHYGPNVSLVTVETLADAIANLVGDQPI